MAFLRTFLICLALCFAALGGVITLVDPYGKRAPRLFPSVLQDDHPQKSVLFREWASQTPSGGVLLGTSRSLIIYPRLLEGLTGVHYFNFAVSDASYTEMHNIYREIRRNRFSPQEVLIGVDPDSLMSRKWKEQLDEGVARGAFLPIAYQAVQDAKATYTLTTLEDTLHSIEAGVGLRSIKAFNFFEFGGAYQSGGSTAPGTALRERQQIINGCAEIHHERFEKFELLSELRLQQLDSLISNAVADRARVTLFLTPLNPSVARKMAEGTPYLELKQVLLERLQALAVKHPFVIRDLSDAVPREAKPEDWSDCTHYSDFVAAHLARRIFSNDNQ